MTMVSLVFAMVVYACASRGSFVVEARVLRFAIPVRAWTHCVGVDAALAVPASPRVSPKARTKVAARTVRFRVRLVLRRG